MSDPPPPTGPTFVSRGGHKLQAALDHFNIDLTGATCADFGASTGGFTDCMLQAGADHVLSLETGYGVLDFNLRRDPRVTPLERTNALHAVRPTQGPGADGVHFIAIDMSWTPQHLCIPAALAWLAPNPIGIVTLLKPHYEASGPLKDTHADLLTDGVLPTQHAQAINDLTLKNLQQQLSIQVVGAIPSPVIGGSRRTKRRRKGAGVGEGNTEYLALIKPA